MRRRRVFLRRESAAETGRTVRVFWMSESGTELRRRNSITQFDMSLSIFFHLRFWNFVICIINLGFGEELVWFSCQSFKSCNARNTLPFYFGIVMSNSILIFRFKYNFVLILYFF